VVQIGNCFAQPAILEAQGPSGASPARSSAQPSSARATHATKTDAFISTGKSVYGQRDVHRNPEAWPKVIAAIADGCVNCAARREGISEVMRVHQRV
jgi:hypothetical protein